jgi:hypothetical protein
MPLVVAQLLELVRGREAVHQPPLGIGSTSVELVLTCMALLQMKYSGRCQALAAQVKLS